MCVRNVSKIYRGHGGRRTGSYSGEADSRGVTERNKSAHQRETRKTQILRLPRITERDKRQGRHDAETFPTSKPGTISRVAPRKRIGGDSWCTRMKAVIVERDPHEEETPAALEDSCTGRFTYRYGCMGERHQHQRQP